MTLSCGPALKPDARAEAWSDTPPRFLQIQREEIKVGMLSKHAKNEARYVAMMEASKIPNYYTALSSDSAMEEWFLIPFTSHARHGELFKLEQKDPTFMKTEGRILGKEGKYVHRLNTIDTLHHPDLSSTNFPDMNKARYVEVTIVHVRPAQEDTFESIAKAYIAAKKRVNPMANFQTYEVMAGMTAPTYITISSMREFGEYDQRIADEGATFANTTAEEKALMAKWGDAVISTETHRLSVDPVQSFVPKEVRAQDPAFWLKK